jgi:hypothetical protein
MTTHKTHSAGGEAMLAVIATAVVVVVATEAAFIAYASWWLLPCLMLFVLAATGVVIYSVMRTIESDTPVPVEPKAKPEPARSPAPAPRPLRGTVVAGH